ncbi:hypothetical protein QE394_001125 [Arthrobacter sp. SORGH_AS 212]|nr:hypothetical protein [Arthrobacter sp. SORGH_AS_0212]
MTRTYNPGTTQCEGSCGRQLRSSRKTLAEYPGTVVRHSGNKCQRCFNAQNKSQAELVRPCKNCDHPTRPQSLSSIQAPGTLKRIGDLCQRCANGCAWVPPEQVDAAVRSLDWYMARRRERGVPAHGAPLRVAGKRMVAA